MGIIKIIQLCILTVDCHRILRQIIRSDTEEINHLRQFVADHHCCRCFNHNSLFRNLIWNSLFCQFVFYFFYNFLDFGNFLFRCNHWIHHRQVPIYRCAKKCTKLCFEDFRLFQADTDGTISHCRVFFFTQSKIIHLFICSNVQCTDNHFLSRHCL